MSEIVNFENTPELRELAERIRKRLRQATDDIIAIGEELITAKETIGHGGFGAWLEAEFGWSLRTAQRYMAAARLEEECFGKYDTVSHLAPQSVYLLSAPSTPPAVREEILRELGQPWDVHRRTPSRKKLVIPHSEIERRVRAATSANPPKPKPPPITQTLTRDPEPPTPPTPVTLRPDPPIINEVKLTAPSTATGITRVDASWMTIRRLVLQAMATMTDSGERQELLAELNTIIIELQQREAPPRRRDTIAQVVAALSVLKDTMATNRSHVAGLLLASELPFTTAEFGAVVAWLEVVVKMRLKRERDAKRDAEEKTIN